MCPCVAVEGRWTRPHCRDDEPSASPFTEKEFRGAVHRLIREALDYIERNFLSVTVIKQAAHARRAPWLPKGRA